MLRIPVGGPHLAVLVALALAVAACGSATPSNPTGAPTPGPTAVASAPMVSGANRTAGPAGLAAPSGMSASTSSPVPSGSPAESTAALAWTRAVDIAQPAGFMTVLTDASGDPYMRGCAPCHPAIDTIMTDVVDGPAGLVAVGWIIQGFKGATWHSTDGSTWSFTDGFPEGTLLSAVASNGTRYAAVGRNGESATAWSSIDGVTWKRTPSTAAFAETPLRLTSVVAWHDGFVAGGFRGTDFFSARGAFWTSPDGVSWDRAPDSPSLADARVVAITVGGPGLVAVGQAGPADHPGPVVVWTSTDGRAWARVPEAATFDGARVRSVASVPGIGLVAVGEDVAGDTGIVWTSRDGISWDRVPSSPTFGRPGIQVRMYDVTASPDGVAVVGTVTEGLQYGVAAVWTSRDGVTWSRTPSSPELLDTEMNAAAPWHDRVVAVGDRGAPDAYQSTAWVGTPAAGQ